MKNIEIYGDRTFEEFYNMVVVEENDIDIPKLPLSNRVINALMRNGITTLISLVKLRIVDFEEIRNLGKSSIDEVHAFVNKIAEEGVLGRKQTGSGMQISISPVVYNNIENIIAGNLDFAEELGEDEQKQVAIFTEAVEVLGSELAMICYKEPNNILNLVASLREFCDEVDAENEKKHKIQAVLNSIPRERHAQKVIGYIKAYTRDEDKQDELAKVYSLSQNPDTSLKAVDYSKLKECPQYFTTLLSFLKWCVFSISSDVSELFEILHEKDNVKSVLQARANGKTLQEIGDSLGITRERVRQIEAKGRRYFSVWQNKKRILARIAAVRNYDTVLSSVELKEYFEEHHMEMVYLLRLYESPAYHYDAQLDVFVLGEESLTSTAFEYVESLPSVFDESEYPKFEVELEDRDIPVELFKKALFDAYQKDGSTYHRIHQTLTEIYTHIMNTYFAEGINIYDEADMNEFRRIAIEEYGCTKLPANDKAIYARIQDFCIVCGKGRYKPKASKYISKDLEQTIHSYIVNSSATIFLTNTIFSIFEDELLKYGIDNKYYMSGVLKELFGDEFFFRRDYISKDDTVTSLYAELVQFIKRFSAPVSKEEVYRAFPGLPEIVLQLAILDPSIINLFGRYIHTSNLPIMDSDKVYFRSLIEKFLAKEDVIHYDDLYEYMIINDDVSKMCKRLFIDVPTAFFSVVEHALKEEYQFKRPFIARYGVEIGNPAEQLREIIVSSDCIAFAEISEFMKENRCGVYSYLDYYNSFSDTHLIASNNELATFSYLGIDESIANEVVRIIEDNVLDSIPIAELPCIDSLPKINVSWHEWLIYSIIRKWSKKLELNVTNSIFKLASPVVSPK